MDNKKNKKKLLIDLDGVLNTYNGVYDNDVIPPIKDGAREFLKILSENFKIKIFTTRNKLQTAKWLADNNIDCYVYDITNVKEPAFLYLDDRCVNFEGDYKKAIADINKFNAYWNK